MGFIGLLFPPEGVCVWSCLLICLSVPMITKTVLSGFAFNFHQMCILVLKTIDYGLLSTWARSLYVIRGSRFSVPPVHHTGGTLKLVSAYRGVRNPHPRYAEARKSFELPPLFAKMSQCHVMKI